MLALDDVDFELTAGEIHALAGENGSGKSTLVKILYGALPPDAGTVEIDGEPVTFSNPRQAIERGIVAISQELTLAPTLTVAENVLMGRLPRRDSGSIDWSAAHRAARAALDELDVHVDPRGASRRAVRSSCSRRSRSRGPSRPTPACSSSTRRRARCPRRRPERCSRTLEQLRARGVAIVFISHRLRELYQCAVEATVLRDGSLVGTVPVAARRPSSELVGLMVGREITDLFRKRKIAEGRVLPLRRAALDPWTTRCGRASIVHEGEIVGIAGLVGWGKAELGLALGGAIPATGEVTCSARRHGWARHATGAPRQRDRVRSRGPEARAHSSRPGRCSTTCPSRGSDASTRAGVVNLRDGAAHGPVDGASASAVRTRLARRADRHAALGREPAEGRPRPVVRARPRRDRAQRADTRDRRRREERGLRLHPGHGRGRARRS